MTADPLHVFRDVDVPAGDANMDRLVVAGGLAATAATLVATVGGWLLLGISPVKRPLATAMAVLVVASGYVAVRLAGRGCLRRPRRVAQRVVLVLSLFGAALAFTVLDAAHVAAPQLRASVAGIALPAGYSRLSSAVIGGRLCQPQCPTLTVRYAKPPGTDDAAGVAAIVRSLRDKGWKPERLDTSTLHKGSLAASVRVLGIRPAEVQVEVTEGLAHDSSGGEE